MWTMRFSPAVAIVFTLLMGVFVASCAVNPATGQRQFSLINEAREIEMGREADGQISVGYGLYEDSDLVVYVSEMGHKLAAT